MCEQRFRENRNKHVRNVSKIFLCAIPWQRHHTHAMQQYYVACTNKCYTVAQRCNAYCKGCILLIIKNFTIVGLSASFIKVDIELFLWYFVEQSQDIGVMNMESILQRLLEKKPRSNFAFFCF